MLFRSLGTAISVALQYGVPVESLVTKFAHQRFEPMGMTTNAEIPFAKSLVDYIFRWMGMQFIPGYREQNAPRRTSSVPAALPAEPAGDSHGRNVKEDTAWAQRMEGGSVPGDRMSPAAMDGSHGSAHAHASGTERIAAILSEHARLDAPGVSTHGVSGGATVLETHATTVVVSTAPANALNQSNAALMGDAPACDSCGSITVRNGTCYRCLNCGNSMGCS